MTRAGTVQAEHVVNAGGLWAREVGALAGVYLPLHPMEHQYFATADIAEVCRREHELPHVMDPAGLDQFVALDVAELRQIDHVGLGRGRGAERSWLRGRR